MKTTIHISTEEIQVVGYSGGKIARYATHAIPEGTMYNGTIMDGALLVECLLSMKKDNPKLFKKAVALVVDGSSILSRRLAVPKLSRKQYLQLVRDDFVDSIGDVDDLVCGYTKQGGAEKAIFGCAVNKVLVERYTSTLEEAGIKLGSIHVGVELILRLVKSISELSKSTIVINALDGLTMLSMVFVGGENIFMSRTRLYGDDKEMVHANILENLSGLIQFVQSQNHDEISESYYLGISEADVEALGRSNPHGSIRLKTFSLHKSAEEVPPALHFSCLDVRFGSRCEIDLLAARKGLDKYIKSKRPKKTWILILAGYALVLAAVAGFLLHEIQGLDRQIEDIRSFIYSPQIVQRKQDIEDIVSKTGIYHNVVLQINEKAQRDLEMAAATSEMLEFILFGHGLEVIVRSFDFNEHTGIVRVNAIAADARVSVDYVNELYEQGVAALVNYQGYGSDHDGMFTFSVDITLAVEEGRLTYNG